MLRSMYERLSYRVEANDGYIGTLDDYLIDDRSWVIRYAVINTGHWLPGRKVLMAREGLGEPDWASRTIPLRASKAEIEAAPGLVDERPVSRQYEEYLHDHYQWAPYWAPGLAGAMAMPVAGAEPATETPRPDEFKQGDPHLRSFNELRGYTILASGEKAGRVDNLMCYDDTWEIPFLVASVGGWFHRESLMAPTTRVTEISFAARELNLNLKKDDLQNLPEYDPLAGHSGRMEICVYDYRGRLLRHEPLDEHARHS